jgi:endonuclease YncB( thermonuclease family)
VSTISVPHLDRIRSLPPSLLYPDGRLPVRQYCYYDAPSVDHSSNRVDLAFDRVPLPHASALLVPDPREVARKVPVVARMTSKKSLGAMICGLAIIFALVASTATATATASPVEPGQVEVLDGDTIRLAGETFRLVGFDTPETYRAQCPAERALGNRATFRLRQLVTGGGLDLERVACACRRGTEGTAACNYGRACGVLTVRGEDVGAVLIAEGLARAYTCGRSSCPARQTWCEPR